ncbi:hypothetical protein BJF78_35475 [Pseudonocardia sp. CNS-139]|nr:hypothetical protein BJF78_35475 [Pseudonocardia sp. CNS-139]
MTLTRTDETGPSPTRAGSTVHAAGLSVIGADLRSTTVLRVVLLTAEDLPVARRELRTRLADLGITGATHDAILLTAHELVTNGVEHARTTVRLAVTQLTTSTRTSTAAHADRTAPGAGGFSNGLSGHTRVDARA